MLNLAVFEWAKTAIFPLNEGFFVVGCQKNHLNCVCLRMRECGQVSNKRRNVLGKAQDFQECGSRLMQKINVNLSV